MKLLLDENLPKTLQQHFVDHEEYTIREKGWAGRKNGELLRLMLADKFDVLLTFEKNIGFPQNFIKYPIRVLQLDAIDNSYEEMRKLVPEILLRMNDDLPPGVTVISVS